MTHGTTPQTPLKDATFTHAGFILNNNLYYKIRALHQPGLSGLTVSRPDFIQRDLTNKSEFSSPSNFAIENWVS
jgi:hypothetical protein